MVDYQSDSIPGYSPEYSPGIQRAMKLTLIDSNMTNWRSGTCQFSRGTFILSTNSDGVTEGNLMSRDIPPVRPGVNIRVRCAVSWATPTAGLVQQIGCFMPEAGFGIGFNGTDFGYFQVTGGSRSYWTLSFSGAINAGSTQPQVVFPGLTNNPTATWTAASPQAYSGTDIALGLVYSRTATSGAGPYVACMPGSILPYFCPMNRTSSAPTVIQGSNATFAISSTGSAGVAPTITWTTLPTPPNISSNKYYEFCYSGFYDPIEVREMTAGSLTFTTFCKIPMISGIFDYLATLPFHASISSDNGTVGTMVISSAETFVETSTRITSSMETYTQSYIAKTLSASAGAKQVLLYFGDTNMFTGTAVPYGGYNGLMTLTINHLTLRGHISAVVNPSRHDTIIASSFGPKMGINTATTTNSVNQGLIVYAEPIERAGVFTLDLESQGYKLKHGDTLYLVITIGTSTAVSGTFSATGYLEA